MNGTLRLLKSFLRVVRGLKAEMKVLRADWASKLRAKAAARR